MSINVSGSSRSISIVHLDAKIAHSTGVSRARAPAIRRFCRDPPIVSRSLWLVRRAVAELPQTPAMFSP